MKQCLIVDGSRVIRRVAARILEDLKFETDEAESGASALEACRHKMPDAILVDAHLPDMPTADFVRNLRREQKGTGPAVIFCTTENDSEEIALAVSAGANDFLLKPFDRESLENKFAEVGLLSGGQAGHARV
ncbi:MAG TPA: response regulator [Rhizomicrobium sp.]|jgi:two-component system chemotaxis response regulator CheY|nr:response regulator [Rhizomicrobium sp.]